MAAKSERVLKLNYPFEQVMPAIEQSINRMGATIINIDRVNGKVTAKKGMNLMTWGDNISISVIRSQTGCSVNIISECALPTQIIDWGSNNGNIKEFVNYLEYLLPQTININELQSSGLMCPKCQKMLPQNTKYCPNDGTLIELTCPACKAYNAPNSIYCTSCGTKL